MIKVLWPQYVTLKLWSAQLVSEYASEYLPILRDENKWQEWAMIVAGSGPFSRANVPKPFNVRGGHKNANFKTWDQWAKVVYLVMYNQE
jgi:hypothetical protein